MSKAVLIISLLTLTLMLFQLFLDQSENNAKLREFFPSTYVSTPSGVPLVLTATPQPVASPSAASNSAVKKLPVKIITTTPIPSVTMGK